MHNVKLVLATIDQEKVDIIRSLRASLTPRCRIQQGEKKDKDKMMIYDLGEGCWRNSAPRFWMVEL